MNLLVSLLSEDGTPGGVSTMRVSALLIVLLILLPRLVVACLTQRIPPLSVEETALILGALGVKAWQRGRESSPSSTIQPSP